MARSLKSKEFGVRLTLPQIDTVLMLIGLVDKGIVEKSDYKVLLSDRTLQSIDALERKMEQLYESVVGTPYGQP
jgi:hypothetical protein